MGASLGPRSEWTEREKGRSGGSRLPKIENKLGGTATRHTRHCPGQLGSRSTLPAAELLSQPGRTATAQTGANSHQAHKASLIYWNLTAQ